MNLDGNHASITEAFDAGLLAGAVTLVWQAGNVLQVNEIGYRDIEARLPMRRDTMFRIASMTKPVTVAAAMTLVDEGRLALTDPVARWLPELSEIRVMADSDGALDKTMAAQRPITSRTNDPPQRLGLCVFGAGSAVACVREAVAAPGPGRVVGGTGRAAVGASARRRVTYSRPRTSWASRCRESKTSRWPTSRPSASSLPRHDRHRVLLRPTDRRRAATMYQLGEDNTLNHESMGPAPITDPPLCRAVRGCGRPPTTTCGSCGCCWRAEPRRGAGAVGRVGASDANRPADRQQKRMPSWACHTGSAAGSG